MTCRAVLHTTKEQSIPLLLVRRGELTPRQCDHEFKGVTGDCPTCKAQSDAADVKDGSSYAQSILLMRARGFGVSYKRFGYGSDGGVEPWRVCYWGHPPGYWTDVPFRNCQSPDTDSHTIALQIIREHYAKEFTPELGFVIKTEPRLRKPGDPPRPYSPDLAIYGPNGERMVAVEYQRSHEAYEKFAERDEMRRSAPENWVAVDWWFDDTQPNPEQPRRTVYDKSQSHRTHLALLGVPLYRCWVDPQTLKLQAEPGRCGELPPDRRKRVERHIEKSDLRECNTAKLIRELEGTPEELIIKDFKKPLRPLRGSGLEFFEDTTYSLERERRLALALTKKQQRLEEQDRRHREFETKCRLVCQIKELIDEMNVLGLSTTAANDWTIERLEREIKRLEEQRPQAELIWDQQLAEAQAQAERAAEERRLAHIERERVESEREQKAAQARAALQSERQREWDRYNAEVDERRRKRQEYEAQWRPIEARDELVRGQEVMKTLVLPGSEIRRAPGWPVEVYQGVSGAGYSTNKATYHSLVGWQIFKRNKSD
jgi:hypothetical protein